MLRQQILFGLVTIVALVIICCHIWQANQYAEFRVDNHHFLIEKEGHVQKKNDSLQTLVEIRKRLNTLVNHLTKKYPNNSYVQRLYHRFKETTLKESNPTEDKIKNKQTSYTINKGDTMVLCLRKVNGEVVDYNTLTYVAIHELAHIYSSSLHHSEEFWENMRFLLREGVDCGIYKRVNYNKNPVKYCGMDIASNLPH